jgi:hypothetical protein
MQRAYFYFPACNSLPYLDLKVYKSYKFNFCVYSFVAQRVTVKSAVFPDLTDFLLTLRFQSLTRLGNFFYWSTSAYFGCLSGLPFKSHLPPRSSQHRAERANTFHQQVGPHAEGFVIALG